MKDKFIEFVSKYRWQIASSAVLLFLLLCMASLAHGQTAPTVNLTVSPTSGVETATPTLTWSSTGATSCTASGGWSGNRATSGTTTLAAVTATTTYTLTCTAGGGFATLTWTAPTQRTDGSALTNLAGYRIKYGTTSGGPYNTVIPINSPGTLTYTVNNMPPATYYFVMSALDSTGLESANSNQASKVVTVPTATASTTLTIQYRPNPPSNVVVAQTTAWEIQQHPSQGPRLVEVGTFAIGDECGPQFVGDFHEMSAEQATRLTGRYRGGILLATCKEAA